MEVFKITENIALNNVPLVRPLAAFMVNGAPLHDMTEVIRMADTLFLVYGVVFEEVFVGHVELNKSQWPQNLVVYAQLSDETWVAIGEGFDTEAYRVGARPRVVLASTNDQWFGRVSTDARRVIGLLETNASLPLLRIHQSHAGNLVVLYSEDPGAEAMRQVEATARNAVDHMVADEEGNDQTPWSKVVARRLVVEETAAA